MCIITVQINLQFYFLLKFKSITLINNFLVYYILIFIFFQKKVGQYWPDDDQSIKFGSFIIKLLEYKQDVSIFNFVCGVWKESL